MQIWLFLILLTFWVSISGKFDPFHIIMGALCTAVITAYLPKSGDNKSKRESLLSTTLTLFRFLKYSVWLLTRIHLAAWHVTKIILTPNLSLSPKLF